MFSFTAPFDLLQMEARLEVLRGDIDLVVGTEDPPSDYFSFGRGPGTQKVRVGRASHEPLIGRPWYVQLVSPFEIQECEEGVEPDWRLSVRRSSGSQGQVLLEQEVQVPACTSPGLCDSASIPLQVPEDALSMELVLESIDGDADLLVGAGDQTERWSSLNLGPGYDVVVIDPQAAIPLRGQELSIVLESWQETTNARLEVTYVPGEVDSETPPAL